MTTAKSVERALAEVSDALSRDVSIPHHPGVHGHLLAAHIQLEAVAKLLAMPA